MWALGLVVIVLTGWALSMAAEASPLAGYSGWRGGIGIAFGNPSRDVPNITEMGYEIAWGSEDPRAIRALDLSVFRYWNTIVETRLKGPGYDFSQMADKNEAARRALDAWLARRYGAKGLSKYATVRYNPKGAYGDVAGSFDLSSDNPLVEAVIDSYLGWFEKNGVKHGGIGLDNAGKVPRPFLALLKRRLNAKGLGIAANGCPERYLSFIDFFGNEGFPFSIEYARQARARGLRGILGEFTMQQLSPGELDAYLKSKLFNGIVFFGYTNGGVAAGSQYSFWAVRPDVYEHQRWVFRRIVPLSRAVQQAGRQEDPCAKIISSPAPAGSIGTATVSGVAVDAQGKVAEVRRAEANLQRITGRSPTTPPEIIRYGNDVAKGIYLYVDSGNPADVACDAHKLGLGPDVLVFDEFSRQRLTASRSAGVLRFRTPEGPCLVQIGSRKALVASFLARVVGNLQQQLAQWRLDSALHKTYPKKVWARFCQGWKLDTHVARSGHASLRTEGGIYHRPTPHWTYFRRQGAAQLVSLNQKVPQPIELRVWSKAQEVQQSDSLNLNPLAARRHDFNAREGHTYSMYLYLDYQDGRWPEVHTAPFTAGSHGWEERTIRVTPTRPVKTAMVLLEFHQPEGTAWFDDAALTQGDAKTNLLAEPGFEEDDALAAKAQAAGTAYEQRVKSLLQTFQAGGTPSAEQLRVLGEQAASLAMWLRGQGLAPYYERELRDLDDAVATVRLCQNVLAERR